VNENSALISAKITRLRKTNNFYNYENEQLQSLNSVKKKPCVRYKFREEKLSQLNY